MFLRGLDTEKTWRVKDLPPPFKETTPMNSPKSQGHGAKTHPGAELQTVGIRWVCLNLTQSFCSSCFPPDPSAPHEALEPPILVPCDLNGIIHLSSPGWLELYLNIVENTTTLSAFSFFSLFLTILTLHPLANLPVFTPPGYAEVPDFFSPLWYDSNMLFSAHPSANHQRFVSLQDPSGPPDATQAHQSRLLRIWSSQALNFSTSPTSVPIASRNLFSPFIK